MIVACKLKYRKQPMIWSGLCYKTAIETWWGPITGDKFTTLDPSFPQEMKIWSKSDQFQQAK